MVIVLTHSARKGNPIKRRAVKHCLIFVIVFSGLLSLFLYNCGRNLNEIGATEDILKLVWKQQFKPHKSWLYIRLYDLTSNIRGPVHRLQCSGGSFETELENEHQYLCLIRLYPIGLSNLANNGLQIHVDGQYIDTINLADYDYFMTYACSFTSHGNISQASTITISHIDIPDAATISKPLYSYQIGHNDVNKGLMLPANGSLDIDLNLGDFDYFSFMFNPGLRDPALSLKLKRQEESIHFDKAAGPWGIKPLKPSSFLPKNDAKNEECQISITFQSSLKQYILKDIKAPLADEWYEFTCNLSHIRERSGRIIIKSTLIGTDQPDDNTIVALSDIHLAKNPFQIKDHSISFPNILLISLDTARADSFGCYGNPIIKTPAIDLLSRKSFQFTKVFSQSNLTLPSHVSLLYSQSLKKHGVYSNYADVPTSLKGLDYFFNEKGYFSIAAISAIQLNPWMSGLGRDFDQVIPCLRVQKTADETVTQVIRCLHDFRITPFFCFLHLMDAHAVYTPPDNYKKLYYQGNPTAGSGPILIDTVPFLKQEAMRNVFSEWLSDIRDERYAPAQYWGEISFIDDQLEQLFREIAGLDLWEDTLILLTADHGESLGEHDVYYDHMGMWQNNFHIPLIIKTLNEDHDLREKRLQHADMKSLLIEHCGFEVSRISDTVSPQDYYILESSLEKAISVVHQQWKLVIPLKIKPFYPKRKQLFDLDQDPQETVNLIASFPDVAEKLEQFYLQWQENQFNNPQEDSKSDAKQNVLLRESLKALGYVDE